jgi:hypothetical protein
MNRWKIPAPPRGGLLRASGRRRSLLLRRHPLLRLRTSRADSGGRVPLLSFVKAQPGVSPPSPTGGNGAIRSASGGILPRAARPHRRRRRSPSSRLTPTASPCGGPVPPSSTWTPPPTPRHSGPGAGNPHLFVIYSFYITFCIRLWPYFLRSANAGAPNHLRRARAFLSSPGTDPQFPRGARPPNRRAGPAASCRGDCVRPPAAARGRGMRFSPQGDIIRPPAVRQWGPSGTRPLRDAANPGARAGKPRPYDTNQGLRGDAGAQCAPLHGADKWGRAGNPLYGAHRRPARGRGGHSSPLQGAENVGRARPRRGAPGCAPVLRPPSRPASSVPHLRPASPSPFCVSVPRPASPSRVPGILGKNRHRALLQAPESIIG